MKDMHMITRSKLNIYVDIEDTIQNTILEIYAEICMLRDNLKLELEWREHW